MSKGSIMLPISYAFSMNLAYSARPWNPYRIVVVRDGGGTSDTALRSVLS